METNSLLDFCRWMQNTTSGTAIRESIWVFPVLEAVHVWSLGLFFGTVAVFDLRLFGVGLRREPVSEVARRLLPWTGAGFACMAASGGLLLWSEPMKCYGSTAFRIKLAAMILAGVNALAFHLTTYRGVAAWDETRATPGAARLAGFVSLALWICVVVSGRLVGYRL
jgi:hypothetical protein